ncbi:MAG: hypothetical protein SGCHY_000382 [Lobulomycetales sp.]
MLCNESVKWLEPSSQVFQDGHSTVKDATIICVENGSSGNRALVLDTIAGKVKGEYELSNNNRAQGIVHSDLYLVWTADVPDGERCICLYDVSHEMKLLWGKELQQQVVSAVMSSKFVFVCSKSGQEGVLSAFDTKSGALLAEISLEGAVFTQMALTPTCLIGKFLGEQVIRVYDILALGKISSLSKLPSVSLAIPEEGVDAGFEILTGGTKPAILLTDENRSTLIDPTTGSLKRFRGDMPSNEPNMWILSEHAEKGWQVEVFFTEELGEDELQGLADE